ncbi:MAG: hypothetical protein HFH23_07145 [Ruminococcus sp.]|nr:hypothetical protein [Ruminococcus sp.]
MVAMYSPLNPLLAKGITTDQAVFFTIARGLLEGKLAYVDFFDHKGVLLYMILAAGLWISESLIGNFVIELTVIFLSAFFLYKIARLFANEWMALFAVFVVFASDITLFASSNSEEYMFPLLCASIYLFLLQLRDGIRHWQVFLIGACGMLVFFIKYNYCLIWAALGILLFLFMLARREKFFQIIRMCLSFGGGMLAATVPFVVYLLVTGSFGAFMDVYVLYSFHYAGVTGMSERIHCLRFLLDTPLSVFYYVAVVFCAFGVVLYFFKKKTRIPGMERGQVEMLLCFVLVSAAILLVTSSPGQSWYYYKQTTMVIYVVPLALFMRVVHQWIVKKAAGKKGGIAKYASPLTACALVLFVLFSIRGRLTAEQYRIEQDGRFASAMVICDLIEEHCDGDDTMISFSNDCTMYFYSGREVASRIFFPSATIVEDELIDELMGDLEKNEPKIITYQCDWEAGLTERMKEEARSFTEKYYSLLYEDEYRSVYLKNK